jgi:class 3 adenylate cyclase
VIESDEAQKRNSVTRFVNQAMEWESDSAVDAALAVTANKRYMDLFEKGDRKGLLNAAVPLFGALKAHDIDTFQFNTPDFKVFLRVHSPSVYGDDLTSYRPAVVRCVVDKSLVYGLEQGRNGYGFRAVAPAWSDGKFIGCVELAEGVNARFLANLNATYAGKWTVVNLETNLSLTNDVPVLETLNEPKDSPVFRKNFTTPDYIVKSMRDSRPYYSYDSQTEEMSLYIPITDFKNTIALYVRYVCKTAYYATVRGIVLNALVTSLLSMSLFGLIFYVLYREIRKPLQGLVAESNKIRTFDLTDQTRIPASLFELEVLVKAVGDMKMGLQSFQKYVPANLVRQLIETSQEARVGGKLRDLTVFFSDITNFTAITEHLAPNELTKLLSEYFDQMTSAILNRGGTVDKYIGDSIMAFWGAPLEIRDHALQACRAALECQRKVGELSRRWKSEDKFEFHTRIGLATGETVVGNIGSEQRLNYTVIGDTVNLASRLEGLNKYYGANIIISGETYNECRDSIEARLLDFVIVKGKTEPVLIYELVGEKGDISPKQKESIKLFTNGIGSYLRRDWD